MNMTNIFEEDAGALKVQNESLDAVAALARNAKLQEKTIAELEHALKEAKDSYRKLTEEILPEALAEIGMKGFTMDDGSQITVKPFYSASISEARRAEAYQWLRDHGFDDIIKNTVSVRFGRGEDELCARLLNLLGEQGFPAEQAEKIEPATLKAWAKEQVERGNAIPAELFGLYVGQKATIKSV